jgi:membrane protein DedA with SNARE-associated domain
MDIWKTILEWIMNNGYLGLFFFGILNFAIPSEVVLPFAGYLVSQKRLDFALVVLAALAGNIVKSSVFFWFGRVFGKDFLIKYKRWTHVDQGTIDFAKSRFEHYGYWIIIPGQFIPYFRRFISGPAGLLRLDYKTFILFNSIGVSLWFGFLATLGFVFGKNWSTAQNRISPLMGEIGWIIGVVSVLLILYEVWRWFMNRDKKKVNQLEK